MSDSGAIGPVKWPGFDQGLSTARRSGERPVERHGPQAGGHHEDRGDDEVDRFAPSAGDAPAGTVVFELLQERVLVHTARALRLDQTSIRPVGYEASILLHDGAEPSHVTSLVDRLSVFQNRLAATRRRTGWSAERVDAAIAKGTLRGVREALDLLEDSDELDDEAWHAVSRVVFELARRLGAAGATGSDS